MDIQILTVKYKKIRFGKCDKAKASIDGNSSKHKFNDVPIGDYALVKIESLDDRIAVEEFIENLKNK
jgi:uncharacterized protein (DUF2141 family)